MTMAQSDRDNNKEVTEIEVLLEGKVYKISGCESVEYMQKVANYINAKERELKASSSYNNEPVFNPDYYEQALNELLAAGLITQEQYEAYLAMGPDELMS